MNDANSTSPMNLVQLKKLVIRRFVAAIIVVGLMFFLPAGTLNYWQAWLWLFIIFFPMALVGLWLLRHDPALQERRMRTREKENEQKRFQKLTTPVFILIYLMPGFDRRFGWSDIPAGIIILTDILILIGYGLFFLVMRENSYASRVVEVSVDQKVIKTGLYAIVRHPMYTSVILMWVLTPLALGSFWAFLPALSIPLMIVIRIKNEEKVLTEELPGYREYLQEVKYRIIPGIW
ncbi:MAG: isoprenylcysteine carboxylmethyltransferase family protein [Candidatus Marinimicrobia bacterium]|nr:isoprenylcysteine carboxylmethyltransferase family protein [Candidatus Neomarinimicrobiota bacterium]